MPDRCMHCDDPSGTDRVCRNCRDEMNGCLVTFTRTEKVAAAVLVGIISLCVYFLFF